MGLASLFAPIFAVSTDTIWRWMCFLLCATAIVAFASLWFPEAPETPPSAAAAKKAIEEGEENESIKSKIKTFGSEGIIQKKVVKQAKKHFHDHYSQRIIRYARQNNLKDTITNQNTYTSISVSRKQSHTKSYN